ncbi:hypothetical protein Tco_1402349 [Tanacetum coccineum]
MTTTTITHHCRQKQRLSCNQASNNRPMKLGGNKMGCLVVVFAVVNGVFMLVLLSYMNRGGTSTLPIPKDVTIDTNLLREEAKVEHDSSFKSLEDIAKDSGPKIEYDISLVTTNSSKKDLNYCFKTFYLYLMGQSQRKPTLAPKGSMSLFVAVLVATTLCLQQSFKVIKKTWMPVLLP